MYLLSAYFDDKTNRIISGYIERIAERTGNTFMTENHVPPHMTLSSIEARSEEVLLPKMEKLEKVLFSGDISVVSVGMFFPYVIYITPVLSGYLQKMSQEIYQCICEVPEVTVSRFYRPMQWLPHITLGKQLQKEEMRMAFEIMQNGFVPFEAKVTSVGLAKVNPHKDLGMIHLG